MNEGQLARLWDRFRRRLAGMVGRGIVRTVDDATQIQSAQVSVLNSELRTDVEHFQPFGFTAVPLPGAECVVVAVGGNRAHPLIVVVDDRRYRKRPLNPGESALYDAFGQFVHLRSDGTLHVTATTEVLVDAPTVRINGNLEVSGNIHATGTILDDSGNTPNHSH